jgi:hypothetical protein
MDATPTAGYHGMSLDDLLWSPAQALSELLHLVNAELSRQRATQAAQNDDDQLFHQLNDQIEVLDHQIAEFMNRIFENPDGLVAANGVIPLMSLELMSPDVDSSSREALGRVLTAVLLRFPELHVTKERIAEEKSGGEGPSKRSMDIDVADWEKRPRHVSLSETDDGEPLRIGELRCEIDSDSDGALLAFILEVLHGHQATRPFRELVNRLRQTAHRQVTTTIVEFVLVDVTGDGHEAESRSGRIPLAVLGPVTPDDLVEAMEDGLRSRQNGRPAWTMLGPYPRKFLSPGKDDSGNRIPPVQPRCDWALRYALLLGTRRTHEPWQAVPLRLVPGGLEYDLASIVTYVLQNKMVGQLGGELLAWWSFPIKSKCFWHEVRGDTMARLGTITPSRPPANYLAAGMRGIVHNAIWEDRPSKARPQDAIGLLRVWVRHLAAGFEDREPPANHCHLRVGRPDENELVAQVIARAGSSSPANSPMVDHILEMLGARAWLTGLASALKSAGWSGCDPIPAAVHPLCWPAVTLDGQYTPVVGSRVPPPDPNCRQLASRLRDRSIKFASMDGESLDLADRMVVSAETLLLHALRTQVQWDPARMGTGGKLMSEDELLHLARSLDITPWDLKLYLWDVSSPWNDEALMAAMDPGRIRGMATTLSEATRSAASFLNLTRQVLEGQLGGSEPARGAIDALAKVVNGRSWAELGRAERRNALVILGADRIRGKQRPRLYFLRLFQPGRGE